jgi:hypothetical protein
MIDLVDRLGHGGDLADSEGSAGGKSEQSQERGQLHKGNAWMVLLERE